MTDKLHLDRAHLHHLYRAMLRIRRFEAKCVELYQVQKIRGFLHLYDGEESIAVGVMDALEPCDAVLATYREHGHALARGVPMAPIMAEMLGKLEGCCRGRGGSMHLFDRTHRFFGGNAIVGGGLPLAVGIAMADKRLRPGAVTACFFGEGAVAEGAFHESMNLASLWKLPVLFVCENNLYAMGTSAGAIRSRSTDLCAQGTHAYNMAAAITVDGDERFGADEPRPRGACAGACAPGPGRGRYFLELPHLPLPRAFDVRHPGLPCP